MQTTGITSHYLQARLRNILQEEGISSRCSEPPYLLKGISNLEALKDTHPAPFSGKRSEEPSCQNERNFWMQTASVKNWYRQVLPVLAWENPWNILRIRKIQTKGNFYQDTLRWHATVDIQRSLKGTVQHSDIFKKAVWMKANYNPNNPWHMHPHSCCFLRFLNSVST